MSHTVHSPIKIGDIFGRLTVSSEAAPKPVRNTYLKRWSCICSCGKSCIIEDRNLKSGGSASCGCSKVDAAIAVGKANRTHGESYSTDYSLEYAAWSRMLNRCYLVTEAAYSRYGGRGITVCDRWRTSYENFLSDMGRKPSPKYSLERKDNNGNYEPKNCCWATDTQQSRNRRSNRLIAYNGTTRCLAEWAELLGFRYNTVWLRLSKGWSIERAFTTPTAT